MSGTVFAISDNDPSISVQKSFHAKFEAYVVALEDLNKLNEISDFEAIKKSFFDCRNAFKSIELFFEYADREYVKDFINGAPLPKLERKSTDLKPIEPSGFQIAEELLFANRIGDFFNKIEKLRTKSVFFQKRIHLYRMDNRMVFEAMREEVVRIATLGITGFDTPSSENTIQECQIAVNSIHEVLSAYESLLNQSEAQLHDSLYQTARLLFQNDFDSFDRFEFIRSYVNPMYGQLLSVQNKLHIETIDLVSKQPTSINYSSTNIFDTDFINYRYFSAAENNSAYDERVKLGELLFFDPILSKNNKRACASCHQPEKAFSDGLKTSIAYDNNGNLKRNSPSLINVGYNSKYFWDLRASNLSDQAEHVILNPDELASSFAEILEKIEQSPEYRAYFKEAFPSIQEVNRYAIVSSLSAYIFSLRSFNSSFDRLIKGESIPNQTEVIRGFNIFTGKAACATCHFIPTFGGNVPPLYQEVETEVLAIPSSNDTLNMQLDPDLGRYYNGIPKEQAEFYRHSFKTPTLRNVGVTAPYMHNGVFNTLEEVVEFYDRGGSAPFGIHPENTTLPEDSLHLSKDEKQCLIQFMESLTDFERFNKRPTALPKVNIPDLENRVIGGEY